MSTHNVCFCREIRKNRYFLLKKLEMCQYDIDAPAQGHPHPHAGILQKMKLKKRVITLIIIGRFYPKSNLTYIL